MLHGNGYAANPETLLLAMLNDDDDKKIRYRALEIILEARARQNSKASTLDKGTSTTKILKRKKGEKDRGKFPKISITRPEF